MADPGHLHAELLALRLGHGLDDRVYRGDHIAQGELFEVQHHLPALDLGDVQDVIDQAEEVLSGGHDLLSVLPHLRRVLRILGEEGGKAQHRVHGRADIMGHVGQKGGLGAAGDLSGLQRMCQLLVVEPALLLLLPAEELLLPPAEVVQQHAQRESDQHGGDDDDDILIDGPPLLLDGVYRHIAHQEDRPPVHGPHIIESVRIPDIVVEQGVPALFQTLFHLCPDLQIADVIGPVEIDQVQVACAPLSHPLGLQNEPFALCIHDV